MQEQFIYRSLIFALVEYGLMFVVLNRGKNFKYVTASILFLLASYQFGEFIFLYYDSLFGISFALFATTLLPPLGLYIVEKRTGKLWLYYLFQIIGLGFALTFLLNPGLIEATQQQFCLLKFSQASTSNPIMRLWGMYYSLGLLSAMVLAVYNYFKVKKLMHKKFYLWTFLAYASFFPTSYVLTLVFHMDLSELASLMCSFAIVAAFIMTWKSSDVDLKIS